jgi:hypothetical protein
MNNVGVQGKNALLKGQNGSRFSVEKFARVQEDKRI